jgi:hypothetical protein
VFFLSVTLTAQRADLTIMTHNFLIWIMFAPESYVVIVFDARNFVVSKIYIYNNNNR